MRLNSRGLRWTEFPTSGRSRATPLRSRQLPLRPGGSPRVPRPRPGPRPGPGWGREARGRGVGGGRVRPSRLPSPRSPRLGAGPAQAAPPAARRPAVALAASHPGWVSSGKARPRAGAPLPPAPPSGQLAELCGRGARERRRAGAHTTTRGRVGAAAAAAAAGGAPRALSPGHLPGSARSCRPLRC